MKEFIFAIALLTVTFSLALPDLPKKALLALSSFL
jgi:hypothetical protein